MLLKKCTNINHEGNDLLPLSSFYKNSSSKDGVCAFCKQCSKQSTSRWRSTNKNSVKKKRRESYIQNKDDILEYQREYYEKNRDRLIKRSIDYRESHEAERKEYHRKYIQDNILYFREYSMKRYAHKLKATPTWYEEEKDQILKLYEKCATIQKDTGIEHQVDHIVPLKGATVCGLHCLANLQILTAVDNRRKRNKF